jgi:hypothetical protein
LTFLYNRRAGLSKNRLKVNKSQIWSAKMNLSIKPGMRLASAFLFGLLFFSVNVSAQDTSRVPNTPLSPEELNGTSLDFVSSPDFPPDAPAAEALSDNSFEAGTPNPVWTESSTNFGSPLCTALDCGTGTGTGPRTGDWWAWFGGAGGFLETASVSQQVTIPVGTSATLSFYLEAIVCDSESDFLEVTIDGNQVFEVDGTSTICGELGYFLVAIPVDAYADGGNHTILFNSVTGNEGGSTNFFVDDVYLEVTQPAISNRATFKVTKYFEDGNDEDEITVSIDCNTGIILDQDKDLANGEWVEFIVTGYTEGNLACTITEDGTTGYSGVYVNESITGAPVESDESCFYAAAEITGDSAHECVITNYPDPVDVTVTKEWVYAGNSSQDIDPSYTLTLYCDAYIEGGYGIKGGGQEGVIIVDSYPCGKFLEMDNPVGNGAYYDWCKAFRGEGEGDYTAEVTPEFPDSNCIWVETNQDSAVEVDQSDCQSLEISAGNGASCTIINTVFFEGIPTLGQHGMAILALLMLSVGFVSFRRFV